MTNHEVMCLMTHAHAKGAHSMKLDTDEFTLTVWFGERPPRSDAVLAYLEAHARSASASATTPSAASSSPGPSSSVVSAPSSSH